jgi:hypothetical protein
MSPIEANLSFGIMILYILMTIVEHDNFRTSYKNERHGYLSTSADIIFERLIHGNRRLVFDVDGVLVKGDSGADRLTHPSLIQSLPILDQHFNLSFVTARGESALPIIRGLVGWPLGLSGPSVIEEGHAWLFDGEVHPLVSDDYISFFKTLRRELSGDGLLDSWNKVKVEKNSYCWGDPRWQGRYTGSLWFRNQDYEIMSERLQELVMKLSDQAKVAVNCCFNSQPKDDLAWMRIGAANFDKAHRLPTLGLPNVYLCDGPNDGPVLSAMRRPDIFLPYMRNTGGLVVAVQNSPDKVTPEMEWVYRHAGITLQSHEDLGDMLALLSQKMMHSSKGGSISRGIPLDCRSY